MAIKIGITGGIGSGKSVVSRMLEVMGIPVYLSDTESKRLTQEDVSIREKLTHLLGEEVYVEGKLNKPLLADYLFANAEQAHRVNQIIHPCVKADFKNWAAQRMALPMVGIESAILIEAGFAKEVDFVVLVLAPKALRMQRVMQRDALSQAEVERRIRSQLSEEEKRRMADFILVNEEETSLIPQVLELISSLSKNKEYLCV